MMKTENNVSLMLRQGYYFSKICAVEITQNQLEGNLPIKITLPMKKSFYSRSVVTGGFRLRYASQRKKKNPSFNQHNTSIYTSVISFQPLKRPLKNNYYFLFLG